MSRARPLPVSVQATPDGGLVIDLRPLVDAIASQVEARLEAALAPRLSPSSPPTQPQAVDVPTAARRLGVSETGVWRLVRKRRASEREGRRAPADPCRRPRRLPPVSVLRSGPARRQHRTR